MSADSDVPDASLAVVVQPDGDAVRLVLVGEIELSTADLLREQLFSALDRHPAAVQVDLAGVTFMDSTGIAALALARNRAISDAVTLTVINFQPTVRRVLEVTGMLGPLTGRG
jgi:anti-sigma B factor antagonist/stage II sporulation protein AA (anti-sigma F factor antagonist)